MYPSKTKLLSVTLSNLLIVGVCLRANTVTDTRTEAPTSALQSIEFRGILQLQDSWQFSFRDKSSQSSFWLEQGRTSHGITPLAFDRDSDILTVEYNGSEHRLELAKANTTPLAVVVSKAQKQTNSHSEQYTIPEAPSFTPPPPPNSGRPPSVAPPSQLPSQPKF